MSVRITCPNCKSNRTHEHLCALSACTWRRCSACRAVYDATDPERAWWEGKLTAPRWRNSKEDR